MRSKFRKGMHLIAKYEGENGDLILGRIESVRSNGEILGINLLTNARFVKSTAVVERRNLVCNKNIAVAILAAAESTPGVYDKKIARREAIAFSRLLAGKSEEKPTAADKKKVARATKAISALSTEQKQLVFKQLLE